VISWERGTEPTRLIDRIVEFSGCPQETWLRREEGVASPDSIDIRLQSLEATVHAAGKETSKALRALTRAIESLEQQLTGEGLSATAEGKR